MHWFYDWDDDLKQRGRTFVAEHITIFARWNGQCPLCLAALPLDPSSPTGWKWDCAKKECVEFERRL
jgi:hypothetical protein